jgi:hypothetical protein
MLQNATKNEQKGADEFVCEVCNYKCCKSFNMERHTLSRKHQKAIKCYINATKNAQNEQNIKEYECPNCSKTFSHSSSMYRHKKTCTYTEEIVPNNSSTSLENKILEIFSKQTDKMLEIIQEGTHNTTNNMVNSHNTNTNNFNLQFYLNETCKDAMNIDQFVSSIQLQLSDLEKTGELGYVKGITRIICNNLNNIESEFRPIHCSDLKREVMYIKNNENQWIKDNENNDGLKMAIKMIARQNMMQIAEWVKLNPEFNNPQSKVNDKYLKITMNAMSGSSVEEQQKNINKIVSNIAKEVTIAKK